MIERGQGLSEAGRHQAVIEWNDPLEYSVTGLLPDLVAARAQEHPEAEALASESERVCYRELEERAEWLAAKLRRRGVGPEVVVAVLLERSAAAVTALLAIWKCGGAYLPLDPEHPQERMFYILQDGLRRPGPRIVLTQPELAGRIAGPDLDLVVLDGPAWEPEPAGDERATARLLPDNTAYVLYTSGSTGSPKGIAVSHGSLANRILWACATELAPGSSFLHKTTLTFDVSLPEIFGPLVAGGRCVLARPGGHRDLSYLAGLIERESITHASFPPATLRLLLDIPGAPGKLRSLRVLITGGETVPPDLPALARAIVPAATLYNRYGPTEVTVSVLTGACDPESRAGSVPLGRPIARARVYVLDERLRLQPPGVPGEIYIGGVCLARGYAGRPELTAERFLPDPIGGEPGQRLYRTGDRGRWQPDGAVEFLGREDLQVKVRGFRVEIEEVEAALNACPGVRAAVVVASEEAATGSLRLVAYVNPEPAAEADTARLRGCLAGRLADYMIPSVFVPCADLPRTLSGKVARDVLVERASRGFPAEAAGFPGSRLEHTLAGLLQELLQVPGVGIDEDFFELGCHSLLLLRLQVRLREAVGAEVPLADIVRNPSVRALARLLETGARGAEISAAELAAEACLDPGIRDTWPGPHGSALPQAPETVFLTGATGFLGSHLLAELLGQTSARVLCLVRGVEGKPAREALYQGLERYGLWRDGAEERIVPVPGDLSRPRLGLSALAFSELAETVDAVYHCGALVNSVYPYEALRATNVEGTREILRLTVQGRPKALHHISTLSVLERQAYPRNGAAPEERLAADPAGITGGYRQSKWVAERLVQTAIERGVRAAIYRPGWISGSSRTGATNASDFLIRLAVGSLQAGVAPEIGALHICPTPVDWAGAGIVWLSLRPESTGGIFHLVNPHPVALEEVLELVREIGYPLRTTQVGPWADTLADLAESGRCALLAPLAGFLRQLGAEAAARNGNGEHRFEISRFASARTQAALAGGAIECPRVDRRLIEAYLTSLAERGFLNGASGGLLHNPGHGDVLHEPARLSGLWDCER